MTTAALGRPTDRALESAIEIAIEIAVIWLVVYAIFRFLRGTRGAGVIKGFFLLTVGMALLIRVLGEATDGFQRLRFLFDRAFSLLAILLIVVFQPEIRAAMSRLGRTKLLARTRNEFGGLAAEVAEAVAFLSKNRFGALIVIERQIGVGDLVSGGVELDAKPSASLIESVFWPNSPLHDLALVIRNGRIWGAGVQLPLADGDGLPKSFGARHRAALGATLESDCVVVVVSEETGQIRVAEAGSVSAPIARDEVEAELLARLTRTSAIVDDVVAGARSVTASARGAIAPGAAKGPAA